MHKLTLPSCLFYLSLLLQIGCSSKQNIVPQQFQLQDKLDPLLLTEAKSIFENELKLYDTSFASIPSLLTLDPGKIIPYWESSRIATMSQNVLSIEIPVETANKYLACQISIEPRDTTIEFIGTKIIIEKDYNTSNNTCYLVSYLKDRDGINFNDEYNSPNNAIFTGLKLYSNLLGQIFRIERNLNGNIDLYADFSESEDINDFGNIIVLAQRLLANYIFLKADKTKSSDTYYGGEIEASLCIGICERISTTIFLDLDFYNENSSNRYPYMDNQARGGGSGSSSNGMNNSSASSQRIGGGIKLDNNFKYKGYSECGCNCNEVAKSIIKEMGFETTGANDAVYIKSEVTNDDNSHGLRDTNDSDVGGLVQHIGTSEECAKYLVSALSMGMPVVVGIDYAGGRLINEGTTDHFVVIYNYGYENGVLFFNYIETGRNSAFWEEAHSNRNILYYDDGSIFGNHYNNDGSINQRYPVITISQYRTTQPQKR
ncbi:MAG: hypothetical protein MJY49_01385 [Bacteroidales bacterium]|nr:hypothetical protein [Bacteroidales bacterium]